MDEKREVQKELFEEFGSAQKRKYPKNLFEQKQKRTIALQYEHLAFIAIGVIVFSIIVFSLGVERGKSASLKRDIITIEDKKDVDKVAISKTDKQQEKVVAEEESEITPSQEEYEQEPVPGYTVQVASYTSEGFAKGQVDKLRLEGYEAFTLHKGNFFIMCIGKFSDKDDAASEKKRLRKSYSDCLVRKIS